MNKQLSGFTIIELMIALAIIGVLAAIAIPAYGNYVKRAKVSEAFQIMQPYETAVSLCAQSSNDDFDVCNSGDNNIPYPQDGRYGNVVRVEHGVITFEFTDETKKDALFGGKVILTPQKRTSADNHGYMFDCSVDGVIITPEITPQPKNCHSL